VSGHGFGPALIAASCRALLRAVVAETDEPTAVITQVHRLLCKDQLDDRFVTAFFGVLEHAAHRLEYVSAGQGPILYFSRAAGTIEELTIQGFPLGLSPSFAFGPPERVDFAPGDFLLLLTDGFFEWFNRAGECFGIERTKDAVVLHCDAPAAEILRLLHASVVAFAAGSPQPDDVTAVLIKRLA
jgi:phosphoserine phosphatase